MAMSTEWIRVIRPPNDTIFLNQPSTLDWILEIKPSKYTAFRRPENKGAPKYIMGNLPAEKPVFLNIDEHRKSPIDFEKHTVLRSIDGTWSEDPHDIRCTLLSHFSDSLGQNQSCSATDFNSLRGYTLLPEDTAALCNQIQDDEIKSSIFDLGDNKSPGVDGFNAKFYKATWNIIGGDICKAVRTYFRNSKMPKSVNSTLLALIPKSDHPNDPADFRPISLCNIIYKVISNIIAKRIHNCVAKLVGMEQSAFIKGRSIIHNILLAQSLVTGYSRKRISPRCCIKIDLRKAFDSVNWNFILSALNYYGFPAQFINWISGCILDPYFSIIFNGSPYGYFKGSQGLRQGCPLSPLLFTLAMEILSRKLRGLQSNSDFQFHPKCSRINLTHLLYADDLFIFCKGTQHSVLCVKSSLDNFASESGLFVNISKSKIYLAGLLSPATISDLGGFSKGSLPVKYLGIPLDSKAIKSSDCAVLLDSLSARINSWNHRMLSHAGRTVLLRSVLNSLQVYWYRVFSIPKNILKAIDSICRKFLWQGESKSPIKWSDVCTVTSKGGLGIKSASHINLSIFLSQTWDIIHKKDSGWIKWLHAYYIKSGDWWSLAIKPSMPWTIRQVSKVREIASLCCYSSGTSASWKIPGCPFSSSSVFHFLQPQLPKPPWYSMVWNPLSIPKHSFTLWQACLARLPTKSRLHKMALIPNSQCQLCSVDIESHDHLFFQCPATVSIFSEALELCHFPSRQIFSSWSDLVSWAASFNFPSLVLKYTAFLFTASACYNIWKFRNALIFKDETFCRNKILHAIKMECRINLACISSIKQNRFNQVWAAKMHLSHLLD